MESYQIILLSVGTTLLVSTLLGIIFEHSLKQSIKFKLTVLSDILEQAIKERTEAVKEVKEDVERLGKAHNKNIDIRVAFEHALLEHFGLEEEVTYERERSPFSSEVGYVPVSKITKTKKGEKK